MKLLRTLVIAAMCSALYTSGGPVLQAELAKVVSNVNPNAGQAFSLITQTGSNWTNISQTISDALSSVAR